METSSTCCLPSKINAIHEPDMSIDDVRQLVSAAIRKEHKDCFVQDLFRDYVVYEDDGTLYQQDYEIEDGDVELDGSPIEVVKVTSYRPVDGGGSEDRVKSLLKKLADKLSMRDEED